MIDDSFDIDSQLLSSTSCRAYDVQELNNDVNLLNSKLNIFHINLRSCSKNLDELITFLEIVKMKFSIIIITETWLKESCKHINIPGFVSYHSVRQGSRRGGGVSIFIDRQIDSSELPNFFINNDVFDCAGIRATIGRETINIIGVYRPPRSSDGNQTLDRFNSQFPNLIRSLKPNERNIIAGDFNVNLLNVEPSNSEIDFREIFSSHFYLPLINLPTREVNDSSSCIDNIFTNKLDPNYAETI